MVPELRPSLDLSGEKLRAASEALIRASDEVGGIEQFATAVRGGEGDIPPGPGGSSLPPSTAERAAPGG